MCQVSKSRQRRRMQLSVNRKLTAVCWMGNNIVSINVSHREGGWELRKTNALAQKKTREGVEKSLRVRRRTRGQRCGKRRSRGRQPRSSSPPPTRVVEEPSDRAIRHLLRRMNHCSVSLKRFETRFKTSNLFRKIDAATYWSDEWAWPYDRWRLRWQHLRDTYCQTPAIRPMWSVSWEAWLDERFRIRLRRNPHGYDGMAAELRQLAVHVRKANGIRFRAIGNRSLARQEGLEGSPSSPSRYLGGSPATRVAERAALRKEVKEMSRSRSRQNRFGDLFG